MAAMQIKLADFEGPLDLLLHLIEKNKIDIYDIPIVSVTEQYIQYLDAMETYDLEIASHFLVLAAMLLQIKSRMLLPKEPVEETEEEGDPRKLLVDMLVEYRKNKKRAEALRLCLEQSGLLLTREPMPLPAAQRSLRRYRLADLIEALVALVPSPKEEAPVIARQEFPIQDKIEEILHSVQHHKQGVRLRHFLHHRKNRGEAIAAFLAVLELLRQGKICISQKSPFAPLYIGEKKEENDGTIQTG